MTHIDNLKRLIDPLSRRLRTILMRGTVTAVDDTHDLQQLQVSRLEGEVLEECERVGQYGFTSVPPIDAEVIIAEISGNGDHHVIIGVDDPSRPHPLDPGQSVIYDSHGTTILLKADGTLTVTASGQVTVEASKLRVVAPTSEYFGDVNIFGDLLVTQNTTIGGTLNGHVP